MRYIKKGHKKKKIVPKPLDKKLEKQAFKIANTVADRLFRQYESVAKMGHLSKGDFRQEAFVGVMDAYKRFDPSKGVKFTSFAYERSRGEILSMLREKAPLVYVPKEVLKKISNEAAFNKSISKLYAIAFESKTIAENNSALKKIAELRSARSGIRPVSWHGRVKGEESSRLFDLIEGKAKYSNPLKRAEAKDLRKYLGNAFDKYLDKRTATILKLRYLSEVNYMPMRAIAESLGISPAMVSKLHNNGLLKLLNNSQFKQAIGLPKERTFSRKDVGRITKRIANELK